MTHFSSIQLKFLCVFIGALFISCIAAMLAAYGFVYQSILTNMQSQLVSTAQNIVKLSDSTDLSISDIIDSVDNPLYSITIYDPSDSSTTAGLEIDGSTLASLDKQSVCMIANRGDNFPHALLKVRGTYLLMSPHSDNNELVSFRTSAAMALLFCAVIGAMLISVAVTQITKPVKRLTHATKEVAKGNFDVTVEYESNDEIGQLTNNFNQMTRELKNMEYLRKDFVSSVSHEFKTPIASIQGFARLLKTKNLTKEEFDEYTDVIISESDRLGKLSSNLLRLSRLENQTIPEAVSDFSLDEQIRRTLLLLENDWSKKNLDLEIDMASVSYTGNEEMIQQIWINLLSNAIKFSHDGGTLWVNLAREPERVKVVIADNGAGIPEEAQPRIFEKFFQGDKSRSEKGNGLGLAIVKQILDSCGGEISFTSEAGKGTAFTVLLPVRSAPKPKKSKQAPEKSA